MTIMTQQTLFDDVLPDVYISRITLETGNGTLQGPTVVPGLAGRNTNLTRPSFSVPTGTHLKITVDLQIQEIIDQNNQARFLDKEMFSKYFRFNLVQVSDVEIVNQLLQLSPKEIDDILLGRNQQVEKKTFKIPEDILGKPSDFITEEYVELIDGRRVVNVPFRHSFRLPAEPRNLSYFIISYLDLETISKDYGFDYSSIPLVIKEKNRKVLMEKVFESGEPVSKTYVFLDGTGQPWTGRVQQSKDGTFIGINERGQTQPIERLVLNNNKIQDFRKTENGKKFALDLSKINNLVSNEKLDSPYLKNKISEKKSFFSPLQISYNRLENVKGLFIFDLRKFLTEQSRYSALFANDKLFDDVIRRSQIKSIRIYRERITGSPENNSEPKNKKFDENQESELVIHSSEKNGVLQELSDELGDITEISDFYLASAESGKRCFSFTDKTIKQKTDGFFTYRAEIDIFDGSIQYIFEKEQKIQSVIRKLTEYLNDANGFSTVESLNKAASNSLRSLKSLSITDNKNWNSKKGQFSKKFIASTRQKYKSIEETPWFQAITEYEDYLLEFTSATLFEITEISKELLKMSSPETGTLDGIYYLVDLLNSIAKNLNKKIVNPSLFGFGDAFVRRPTVGVKAKEGLLRVSKTFSEVVDTSRILDTGVDFLDIEPTVENVGVKKINLSQLFQRVKREYNTIFNLQNDVPIDISIKYGNESYTEGDNLDRTGYSFLGPSYVVRNGEKIITRVGNSPSPLVSRTSLASYGVSIAVRTENLGIKNDMIIHETPVIPASEKTDTSFFGIPKTKTIQTEEKEENTVSDSLVSHFSGLGMTIGKAPNISVEKFDVSITRGETLTSDRVSRKLDLPFYAFAPVIKYPPREDFTSLLMYLLSNKKGKKTNVGKYNLFSENNYLTSLLSAPESIDKSSWWPGLLSSTKANELLKYIPNQTKAIFLEASSPEKVKKKWSSRNPASISERMENLVELDLYQNNIQAIEVLVDFETTDLGYKEINTPKWVPLTPDLFDRVTNRSFVCRLRQYMNEIIGVIPREEKQNVFDEVFIVLPTQGFQRGIFGAPFRPLEEIPSRTLVSSPFAANPRNLVDRGLISELDGNIKDVAVVRGETFSVTAEQEELNEVKKSLMIIKKQQEEEQKNVSSLFTTTNITGVFLNKKI